MGRALGLRWAANGHDVLFGSRDLSKAKEAANLSLGRAKAGDLESAAAFGSVVLYTVRDLSPNALLRNAESLAGKIVIDCNNSDMPPDFNFPTLIPSLAEKLAADIPQARVVKAFNTMSAQVIALDQDKLASQNVSVFLCGDDAAAKSIVSNLAEELGFTPVDCGALGHARLVESVADFIRFQIIGMHRGPFATISVTVLPVSADREIKDHYD
jgi:8-hydroxy-5-deazaflavin:NADPH oxidoreductase